MIPEEIVLDSKSNLNILIHPTTNINQDNFSEYFISHHEGILNDDQSLELNSFLSKNPKLTKEFQLYGSVVLNVDVSIKFPDKNALLKKTRPTVPFFWSISAAASILMVIGVWLFWPTGQPVNGVAMGSIRGIQFSNSFDKNKIMEEKINTNLQTNNKTKNKNQNNHSIAVLNNTSVRDQSIPVQLKTNNAVEMNMAAIDNQLALQPIPHIETNDPLTASTETPKKKGLLNKIFSGEQVYIEDYVNATFGAFKNNKEDDDKWVLKVERDNKGKSKKVKFTSPIFSFKTKN